MDGDARIAQHGFGTRRRNNNVLTGVVCQRIAEVPQIAVDVLAFNLKVRDGRAQLRIPVHQARVFIDNAFTIKADEHLLYCTAKPFIHCEALPVPIRCCTQIA